MCDPSPEDPPRRSPARQDRISPIANTLGSVPHSSLLLIERARAGDNAALDELVRRYLPRLRRWASGRLPAAARGLLDTDDIVQETMVKAVRNLGHADLERDGALQAYLRQAVNNRVVDAYRHARGR